MISSERERPVPKAASAAALRLAAAEAAPANEPSDEQAEHKAAVRQRFLFLWGKRGCESGRLLELNSAKRLNYLKSDKNVEANGDLFYREELVHEGPDGPNVFSRQLDWEEQGDQVRQINKGEHSRAAQYWDNRRTVLTANARAGDEG